MIWCIQLSNIYFLCTMKEMCSVNADQSALLWKNKFKFSVNSESTFFYICELPHSKLYLRGCPFVSDSLAKAQFAFQAGYLDKQFPLAPDCPVCVYVTQRRRYHNLRYKDRDIQRNTPSQFTAPKPPPNPACIACHKRKSYGRTSVAAYRRKKLKLNK